MRLSEIIRLCERVAVRNSDEFGYKIDVEVEGTKITYRLECFETADDHEFVSGSSETCDCFDITEKDIEECAQAWGYEVPWKK